MGKSAAKRLARQRLNTDAEAERSREQYLTALSQQHSLKVKHEIKPASQRRNSQSLERQDSAIAHVRPSDNGAVPSSPPQLIQYAFMCTAAAAD
jgi:hypothetical protein